MSDRPLILTGFMGSGKSSVGKLLSQRLGLSFIDLDETLVAATGKSINAIFAEDGEPAFRLLESACLEQVLKQGMGIISTGGGAVLKVSNRELMAKFGVVVNLIVSLPQALERLATSADRPLYAGGSAPEQLRRLMEEREPYYSEADIRIDTNGKSVEDVANDILYFLKEWTV